MDGAALSAEAGQWIDGRYLVERVLGRGGMAYVVAARHVELDELVAIKILLPQRAKEHGVRERFMTEARAAVKIKSEHVARVTHVGALDDGTPYMVMDYLDGEDVAALLGRRGSVPVPEAVLYILHACDALREAHGLGIVHRDLKPANLFVAKSRGRPPSIKVLDFGISKIERHDRRRTETKEVLGSPWYMAPEQLKRATSATARSDVWSLGIILYELVTGDVPFDGETMAEVIVNVLHAEPNLEAIPRELRPIVGKCLQKTAADRFASMDDLAAALREVTDARVLDGDVSPRAGLPARPSDAPVTPRASDPPFPPRASNAPMPPRASNAPIPPRASNVPRATAPTSSARPAAMRPSFPPRSSSVPTKQSDVPRVSSRPPTGSISAFLEELGPSLDRYTPTPELVGADEVELIDEGATSGAERQEGIDEEAAMVQDHELLPSKPPSAVAPKPVAPLTSSPPAATAQDAPDDEPTLATDEKVDEPTLAADEKVDDEPFASDEVDDDIEAAPPKPVEAAPPKPVEAAPPKPAPSPVVASARPKWVALAVAATVIGLVGMMLTKSNTTPSSVTPEPSSAALPEPAPSAIVAAPRVSVDPPPPAASASATAATSSAPPPSASSAVPSRAASTPSAVPKPTPTAPIAPPPAVAVHAAPPKAVEKVASPSPAAEADDQTLAAQAVRRNFVAVQTQCWEGTQKTTASAMVNVSTTVAPSGLVTGASATAADAVLARCVEAHVRTWSFPTSSRVRTLQLAIRFRR